MPSGPQPPPPPFPQGGGPKPRPQPQPHPHPQPHPQPHPPSAGPTESKPLSRRSLLGLGALAGAGAGAAVAAGISAGQGSDATSVVDSHGTPVVSARPQKLSAAQQQQAATNIGVVRTVEPEQFPGSSDDAQFAAALRFLGEGGGVIRLRPGKSYIWHGAIAPVDWSAQGGIVLSAWGATVTYTGGGSAFTSRQTKTRAGTKTLTVLGGEWVAPQADAFFTVIDSGNHLFYRCRGEVPNGTFFHLSNEQFWSERNHFIEIDDHNCREVIRFTIDGSEHESFARTVVRDLRLSGGQAGFPKINVVAQKGASSAPAPYDSTFDGINGNIADGVIVQRLAGGMSGTKIGRIQVESPEGSTSAAVWQVGELAGKLPLLPEGPPILRNLIMFTADSLSQNPFAQEVALGGLAVGGAISGFPVSVQVNRPSAIVIPADQGNLAVITLKAACTGASIESTLTRKETQSLTVAFVQDGAGGHAYTWPGECRFAQNAAPVDTTPNTQTSVTFSFVNGLWLETARAVGVPIA